MKDSSKDLLIAEFETSWQQLFSIDARRGVFFNYFNVAFFAVLSFTAAIWIKDAQPSFLTSAALTATYLLLGLMAHSIKRVLESERAANLRYRKKINLIREIFLAEDEDSKIQMYLKQKDMGIKTFSGAGNEIDKIGGTLKPIYDMLLVQQIVLAILVVLVWVAHYGFLRAA